MAEFDIDAVRLKAQKATSPLKPASDSTQAEKNFLFAAKRTDAGRNLPPYYLVYFLLVDLLGFRNLGQFEKTAWSVPVEFEGQAFLIEHRKMGLGIFAANLPDDEPAAARIATLIHKGVKAASAYFDCRAQEAAKASNLNVLNRSPALLGRLEFLLGLYDEKCTEAREREDESIKEELPNGAWLLHFPSRDSEREASWLALSAIESFFAWTEHVFIHIAILHGSVSTGEDVEKLARADWPEKFKAALDVSASATKTLYDELIVIRRQLRNFVAHGSFGKDGEAFQFHSNAGAVPMLLPHNRDSSAFRFGQGVDLIPAKAIGVIRRFMSHVWSGPNQCAKIHVQDYALPAILTKVANGDYARAMSSVDAMTDYADYWSAMMGRSHDMDF